MISADAETRVWILGKEWRATISKRIKHRWRRNIITGDIFGSWADTWATSISVLEVETLWFRAFLCRRADTLAIVDGKYQTIIASWSIWTGTIFCSVKAFTDTVCDIEFEEWVEVLAVLIGQLADAITLDGIVDFVGVAIIC